MIGLNRDTGRPLTGWPHVLQCLEVLFTTRFGERIMRRYFGTLIPHMIGERIVQSTMLRFFYSVAAAIELWEPRFRVVKIDINNIDRQGEVSFTLRGLYLPNATVGDLNTQQRRSFTFIARQTGIVLNGA